MPVLRYGSERGSVFVLVLLISFGLITIALYFANSMSLELRAADNRTSGMASDQIIQGAQRYVASVLATYATNGAVPDINYYQAAAVPVGKSITPEENGRFWLIGRDVLGTSTSTSEPYFSLVDESSKLDLNAPWLNADLLSTNFPNMTIEFANAIVDWRDTNGTDGSLNYVQYGYSAKHSPFESVGELRLVYGATMELLAGDDLNRNGVLDASEQDLNGNGYADEGLLGYFTVYNRQPNTHSDGTALTNVNTRADIQALLESRFGTTRATEITTRLFGNQGAQGQNNNATATGFASLLQFYMRSGLTSDEFGQIYNDITVTNTAYTVGRVNVNTASANVLACLPGMNIDVARQLVTYRQSNPTMLTSFAWIVDALGSNSPQLQALASGDYITAHSCQFSADIAAVGPFGRGYRRVRFVFDISEGTPKVIYRQDLSGLGWALGKETRQTWLARNTR